MSDIFQTDDSTCAPKYINVPSYGQYNTPAPSCDYTRCDVIDILHGIHDRLNYIEQRVYETSILIDNINLRFENHHRQYDYNQRHQSDSNHNRQYDYNQRPHVVKHPRPNKKRKSRANSHVTAKRVQLEPGEIVE